MIHCSNITQNHGRQVDYTSNAQWKHWNQQLLVEILTKEQRGGGSTTGASFPTMVVAQQRPITNMNPGGGTVHSYNSSQLSCVSEGNGWKVGAPQNNDQHSSNNRYTQERTAPNSMLVTPSQWNTSASVNQVPPSFGISDWNNNNQYANYTDSTDLQLDNFERGDRSGNERVSLQRVSNNFSMYILTHGGP
jgi:hypothetical protein